MRVRVLISIFLPFLSLLFVGFFALSVLLENLLFFYCCESGWYLICWKNTFCGFYLTTQINFSLWKGLESKKKEGKDTKGIYHLVLTDVATSDSSTLNSQSECVWTTCLSFTWGFHLLTYLMWCKLPPSPSNVIHFHGLAQSVSVTVQMLMRSVLNTPIV